MYNSPKRPTIEIDPETGEEVLVNDAKKRTTLISNRSRVYKGGSWADGAMWLSPGTRRFLAQDSSTATVGFRCATTALGTAGNGM